MCATHIGRFPMFRHLEANDYVYRVEGELKTAPDR